MTPFEKIEAEVMELSPDERLSLVYHILDTVSNSAQNSEIEEAWIEEAERRLESFDKGEEVGVPAEEVFAKARIIIAGQNHT